MRKVYAYFGCTVQEGTLRLMNARKEGESTEPETSLRRNRKEYDVSAIKRIEISYAKCASSSELINLQKRIVRSINHNIIMLYIILTLLFDIVLRRQMTGIY